MSDRSFRPLLRDFCAALGIIFVVSVFWPFLIYAVGRHFSPETGGIKWLAVLECGLWTPLWEEAVFRLAPLWLATRRFPDSWRIKRAAMLFATLGFALAHLASKDWYVTLVTEPLVGYALASLYLAHEKRSIALAYAACVAAHGIFIIGRLAMAGPFAIYAI